jgi:phage tail-like protein
MALTKDQIRKDYPLPIYNYKVDIGSTTVAFSEVSGLDISFETITYNETQTASGIAGPNTMYMPSWQKPINITLKKGVVKAVSIPVLYEWIKSTELNRIEKKDITVHLCDEKGESVIRWKVIDAFPTRLSAPDFNAGGNEAAIETMELMASDLVMSEG